MQGITIDDIQLLKNEEDNAEVFVRVDYTIDNGISTTKDNIITKL